ncbi:MAG: hypothetical protein ACKV22_08970 [Bryobacteraceae bacterium]
MRVAFLLLALLPDAYAHDYITTRLTWAQEISRILYRRCYQCHGPSASIPLTTYEEVRPWAKAIREEVLERRMPPWDAAPGFGEFRNDSSLTQLETDWLVDWVEGGAPRGNELYLPDRPPANPPVIESMRPGLRVTQSRRLTRRLRLTAIQPVDVPPGGSLHVLASLPDGGRRYLLWIPQFRKTRVYWLREPMDLPAGSVITVQGAGGALVTGRPPGS